jgi:4-amino-4-deoxy-L-arabinose transferase-like glycosyltransferase
LRGISPRFSFHKLENASDSFVTRFTDWVTAASKNGNIAEPSGYLAIGFFLFTAWVLFSNLGGVALFEPDEGRNAEIAREILLLKDWVTPHYDFIPRLDKPILYFDLVALAYKLFGFSEWSARLPSALAALACLSLTYGFARSLYGRWAALWSTLILLTSGGFFGLSRVVILDMLLTLLLTLALCCFFWGQAAVDRGKGKIPFLLMHAALGAATLIKGPIGVLLPAAVILFYLFFTKRWMLLRRMEFALGIPLFLLTAAPWYVLVELRNPGYLNHFFWQENVARFTTAQFRRTGSWYYFIEMLSLGFLPWTILLPTMIARLWKRWRDDERLFLILWIALPLLFFSLSSSKLFHYILPVYPPLAIIVGACVADSLTDSSTKFRWLLSLAIVFYFLASFLVVFGVQWPELLPYRLRPYIPATFATTSIELVIGMAVALMLVLLAIQWRPSRKHVFLYSATCVSFALFILFAEPIVATVALHRSSKVLAEKAVSFIRDEDQLVIYEGYPSSLPFYLNLQRPIWVVWSGTKSKVLGSDYVAQRQPKPVAGYGQVLFTYEEFAALWRTSKHRFVVFVDSGAMNRFELRVGAPPRVLLKLADTVLVENRGADRNANDDDQKH